MDRRSVLGAVAIAAVVALFVFVVPLIDDSLEQSRGFDEAGRFIVDEYAAMELTDGWEVESRTEFLTTLTNGPYAIIVVSSYVGDTAPADSLKDRRDLFAAEAANTVTEIETFSTDAGGEVAGFRALIATEPSGLGSAIFAVSDNGRLLAPVATGPADLDDPFYEEIEGMLRSIVMTAEPRSES